jgi:hypothetical protein
MAKRSYSCRHCGTTFIPQPEKPGYIDECPDCLHEQTRPKPSADLTARFARRYPKRVKALKDLRKNLVDLGMSESDVEGMIADVVRQALAQ